jgi:hypothetical protein
MDQQSTALVPAPCMKTYVYLAEFFLGWEESRQDL